MPGSSGRGGQSAGRSTSHSTPYGASHSEPSSATRSGTPLSASHSAPQAQLGSRSAGKERQLVGDVVEPEHRPERVPAQHRQHARVGQLEHLGRAPRRAGAAGRPGPRPGAAAPPNTRPSTVAGSARRSRAAGRQRAAGAPTGCRRRAPGRRPRPGRWAAPARRRTTAPARRPSPGRTACASSSRATAGRSTSASLPPSRAAASPASVGRGAADPPVAGGRVLLEHQTARRRAGERAGVPVGQEGPVQRARRQPDRRRRPRRRPPSRCRRGSARTSPRPSWSGPAAALRSACAASVASRSASIDQTCTMRLLWYARSLTLPWCGARPR